jgi:hypothetical protein
VRGVSRVSFEVESTRNYVPEKKPRLFGGVRHGFCAGVSQRRRKRRI